MAGNRMMRWFEDSHLPEDLREVTGPIRGLAEAMDQLLPESAEKTAGLRKLVEAKDCLVRSRIESRETSGP